MVSRVPEYPHPPLPEGVELPPKEALLVGGPFDGRMHNPCVRFLEPGERAYHLLYEKGIIDDETLYSREFPEGAVYRWTPKEKCWEYIGAPPEESQENYKEFLEFFGIEPEEPL